MGYVPKRCPDDMLQMDMHRECRLPHMCKQDPALSFYRRFDLYEKCRCQAFSGAGRLFAGFMGPIKKWDT